MATSAPRFLAGCLISVAMLVYAPPQTFASDILVPEDYPTIQQAIDAASNADSILVKAGVYREAIDFSGKTITVRSRDGMGAATIRHVYGPSIVSFASGEGPASVLEGFHLTGHKSSGWWEQAAVAIYDASPTIVSNRITDNGDATYAVGVHGIYSTGGSPRIIANEIRKNEDYVTGGGGIYASGGAPFIANNVIEDNWSKWGDGGGVRCSGGVLANNLIIGNSSGGSGGGISSSSSQLHNNTVLNNADVGVPSTGGGGISANGGTVTHCIVRGNQSLTGQQQIGGSPVVTYSNVEGGYAGQGNIDADPLFVDGYRLSGDSLCVDAGKPGFVPANGAERDPDGNSRLLNGDLEQTMRVDMGAYEFTNVRLSLTGDMVPGGTIVITTSGTPGLSTLMLVGFSKGLLLIDPFGYLFFDIAGTWGWRPWPSAPSSVPVTLPGTLPPGFRAVFQELVMQAPGQANTSNAELLIIP
ncbi:MAG: right-handed parallel beta-helix repeat-containing protein [Planctomycetota bacterium]